MADVKIKTQKIIKVGNSYAVTLDKSFVDQHNLKVNEPIVGRYSTKGPVVSFGTSSEQPNNPELTQEERKSHLMSQITPEFQEWVEQTLEEDAEAMEKLANL